MRHVSTAWAFAALCIGIAVASGGCGHGPGATAAGPAGPEGAPAAIDLHHDGDYRAGHWEYRYRTTAAGSKSEGERGELLYDGLPVDVLVVPGDYHRTPWGDIVWLGDAELPWGSHGWFPRDAEMGAGHALVTPVRAPRGPVVMAAVLGPAADVGGAGVTLDPPLDAAAKAELARLGATDAKVARAWFPLTHQAATLGAAAITLRLAQPREAAVLGVLRDGAVVDRIDLPRQDGATRLVPLGPPSAPARYLALRVERAARDWGAPLDLGPEVDGKTIAVRGVHTVVLALPADRDHVWTVTSLGEDPLQGRPFVVVGGPQLVRSPGPSQVVCENLFGVRATGTAEVTLSYHPATISAHDAPQARTFHVTLRIERPEDLPAD